MEFWGVEVKPGESLKVQPEFGKLIHISQAALGEVNDVKGAKRVPLRLTVDSNKYIIGTLSAVDRPQLMFDLVLERDFELSHDWKNGSIYFIGYVADDPVSDGEELSDEFDDESEDELLDIPQNGDIKAKSGNVKAVAKSNKAETPGSDKDEDDSESDSDDELPLAGEEDSSDVSGEGSDDDEEDDSSEEEMPKKVQQSKKRPAEPAQKTPTPAKKAKQTTPEKTGNKKGGYVATPFPSKASGKSKAKDQSGGQVSRNSSNKSSTSEKALQSHKKAKHASK